jgi:hypothetical protein
MLELGGINTSTRPDAPLIVSTGGKSIAIGAIPGLMDKKRCGHALQGRGLVFSYFELEKNLPGAFAEVMSALA